MLTPTLIDKGYIYIAESPSMKFLLKTKLILRTLKKKDAIILSKIKTKAHVQRSKRAKGK